MTVLSRDTAAARAVLPAAVKVAATSSGQVVPQELLPSVEAFVHLAAEPLAGRWTRARRQRIVESRTRATQALADALRSAPALKVFVNASGVGFYGSRTADVDERDTSGDGFVAEITAARELAAERVRTSGRRVVHARIGIVLHSEGGYLQQLGKLRRMGLSGQFGSGEQGVSWIHRDDVVSLLARAVVDPAWDGPFNVCAPAPASNAEVVRAVRDVLGRCGMPLPAPLAVLMLGELGRTLLGGQRVRPHRAEHSGYRFQYPELDGALRALFPSGASSK